jgi:glucose/arabinose dehydrogenase
LSNARPESWWTVEQGRTSSQRGCYFGWPWMTTKEYFYY